LVYSILRICGVQDDVAACFDYYADLAEKLDGRQWQPVDLGEEGFKSEIRREPLGAVSWAQKSTVTALSKTMRNAVTNPCSGCDW